MHTTEQPPVNANIHHGNATVVGTEKGWALPGGVETRNENEAKRMAIRMSKLMMGLEL